MHCPRCRSNATTTRKPRTPLDASPGDVFLRALIERYGDEQVSEEGSNLLTAFQRDGADRARAVMDRYGGVLYADGVGMGKTEIGIDLIREHVEEHGHHALVVASAQLRNNMWRPRLDQENLPAAVVSYQELARDLSVVVADRRIRDEQIRDTINRSTPEISACETAPASCPAGTEFR